MSTRPQAAGVLDSRTSLLQDVSDCKYVSKGSQTCSAQSSLWVTWFVCIQPQVEVSFLAFAESISSLVKPQPW